MRTIISISKLYCIPKNDIYRARRIMNLPYQKKITEGRNKGNNYLTLTNEKKIIAYLLKFDKTYLEVKIPEIKYIRETFYIYESKMNFN